MREEMYISLDMIMSGQILRNMISKHGYTIKEIQKKLNLSCPQPIYRWMSGKAMPTLDNLYMLSHMLGTHMEDLLVPRQDHAWYIHTQDNRDRRRRFRAYWKAVNAHG